MPASRGLHRRSSCDPALPSHAVFQQHTISRNAHFNPNPFCKYPSPILVSRSRLNPLSLPPFSPIAFYHPFPLLRDVVAYSSLLRSCASSSSLPRGMHLHHHIIQHGLELHPRIQNLLLHLYCKCGALYEARFSFSRHPEPTLFSWDFIIRAYINHGSKAQAIELFKRMQQEASLPDKVIYSSTLLACGADQETYHVGQKLHALLMGSAFLSDIVLITAFISLYNKCRDIDNAKKLFHGSSEVDDVCCNAMIEACVQHGDEVEALHIYERMHWEGFLASGSTFVSVLSLFINTTDLTYGKGIHVRVIENDLDSDIRVATALVSMYGRCGGLNVANKLFRNLNERDVVIWNALLAAYAQNGQASEALTVYGQMQLEGFLPDRVTFVSVLQACSSKAAFFQGQRLHACVRSANYDSDLVLGNTLVTMYSKCGKFDYAQIIFEKLPGKDVVSWSAMIGACAQHGHAKSAWQFLYDMLQEGVVPNEVTLVCVISAFANLADPIECKYLHIWLVTFGHACARDVDNALISMYAKSGSLEDAQELFSQLVEKDKVSWNALISACAQNGYGDNVLQLYQQMQLEGVFADSVVLTSVLAICAEHADLLKGQHLHVQILSIKVGLDEAVWNSILNMYGKCGLIMKAYSMFKQMASRNLVSWNSMITGCAQHGDGNHALQLLLRMQKSGVQPDDTTFTSVLTACNRSGLVEEGQICLVNMIRCLESGVTLDHVNSLVDALGRLGRTNEAWSLMFKMPFRPSRPSHASLLDACRHHIDVELGQLAAKHAIELVPEDTALPVLMSNLYGMSGAEELSDMQEIGDMWKLEL